jgi:hypothetical protein
MSIELPAAFGPRINQLVACLDRYDDPGRVLSNSERVNLQREAISLCCTLLTSLNLDQLQEQLQRLLNGDGARMQAAAILRASDLYRLFEIMEAELLERAGLNFAARERILALLSSVRYQAAEQVTNLDPKAVTTDVSELRAWTCQASSDELLKAESEQDEAKMHERHTALVHGLGTVAIVVNAGAAFATAASLLFLPVMSVAAFGASAAAGAVAHRQKARKPEASPGGRPGARILPRPPEGKNLKVKSSRRR